MARQVTIYTTRWSSRCRRLKTQLDREGIPYTEVDINSDPTGAAFVGSVNGGAHTVPTVVFPDGSALAKPSLVEVKERLASVA